MFEIKGKYTTAKVMIDELEPTAIGQISNFVNHPAFTNPVAIMPDAHYGRGAVIGFSMEMTDKVIPGVIGVDIGCGVIGVNIGKTLSMSLPDLDKMIRAKIPFGTDMHEESVTHMAKEFPWKSVMSTLENFAIFYQGKFGFVMDREPYTMDWFVDKCNKTGCNLRRGIASLGSLGSGNHYIELGVDNDGNHWLTLHSGSRNFGKCTCDYWQGVARKRVREDMLVKRHAEIDQIKSQYQGNERYHRIQEVKNKYGIGIDTNGLEWLEGEDAAGYLRDMIFAQAYAAENRQLMIDIILNILKVDPLDRVETIHNYINFKDGIIRKGAVSAQEGERFWLPFNMRDGILICTGKGNIDWNVSAPHGAGRAMSRGQAKRELNLNRFIEEMEGIYSTSVGRGTIDEGPSAYKDATVIEEAIEPTAAIVNRVRPILNMKDGEGRTDDNLVQDKEL